MAPLRWFQNCYPVIAASFGWFCLETTVPWSTVHWPLSTRRPFLVARYAVGSHETIMSANWRHKLLVQWECRPTHIPPIDPPTLTHSSYLGCTCSCVCSTSSATPYWIWASDGAYEGPLLLCLPYISPNTNPCPSSGLLGPPCLFSSLFWFCFYLPACFLLVSWSNFPKFAASGQSLYWEKLQRVFTYGKFWGIPLKI